MSELTDIVFELGILTSLSLRGRHCDSVLWLYRVVSASHCAPGRCPAPSAHISSTSAPVAHLRLDSDSGSTRAFVSVLLVVSEPQQVNLPLCAFISGVERKTLAQVGSLAAMSPTEAGHSHSTFLLSMRHRGPVLPWPP